MTDYNDPNLLLEHKLREYIETQRASAERMMEACSQHHSVNISFDTNGKWAVQALVKSDYIYGRGAQLTLAVEMFNRAVASACSNSELPALLPAPLAVTVSSTSDGTGDDDALFC